MFGAGGQGPTKQWHYDYFLNEPLWVGAPEASEVIVNLARYEPADLNGFIGISSDEHQFWYIGPNRPLLGSGIASPFINLIPRFDWDDPGPWQRLPVKSIALPRSSPQIPLIPPTRPDDASTWLADPIPSLTILLPKVPVYINKIPRYDYDDPGPWQRLPTFSLTVLIPTLRPFIPLMPHYDHYEPGTWYAAPLNSDTIYIPVVGKPFVPPPPSFNYDETFPWDASPTLSYTISIPPITAIPNKPQRPRYDADDQAYWRGQGIRSNLLSIIGRLEPATPTGTPAISAEEAWYPNFHNALLIYPTPPKPFFSGERLFNYDEYMYRWRIIQVPTAYIPPPAVPMAMYRLLADHYFPSGYISAGTIVTEGDGNIPIGWVPTLAVDPLNSQAIQAFWQAGPRAANSAQPNVEIAPGWWMRWANQPVAPPTVYWQKVANGLFRLTGGGSALGIRGDI
jgi:hypothetical protein